MGSVPIEGPCMVRPYRDDVCMYLLLGSCRTDRNRNAYIHRIREELKPGRASLAGASRGAQQEARCARGASDSHSSSNMLEHADWKAPPRQALQPLLGTAQRLLRCKAVE